MKKTIIPISILFFAVFTALGQSVTLEPTQSNQLSVHAFSAQRPTFSGYHSTGLVPPRTATLSGRMLVGLQGFGNLGSGFNTNPNASIELRAAQDFSTFQQGTDISFYTTSNGSTTSFERMRISNNGNVGIGNGNPNGNLSFSNTNNNRKVVLYEDANNEHQFMGFGVNSQIMRYQIPSNTNSHVFYTGTSSTTSAELMRITGLGRVGINTNNPETILEVKTGPAADYGFQHTDGTVRVASYVSSNSGGWMGTRSNHPFNLYANNGSVALQVSTAQNVSIGKAATNGYKLEVHQSGNAGINLYNSNDTHSWEFWVEPNGSGITGGDLALWADGTAKGFFDRITGIYTISSDRRLKKNIVALEDVLSKVMELKASKYQYIANNPHGVVSTGFIAQEVEPLFPQFVGTGIDKNGKETKTMDYSGMSVIAIKAIQEQQELIVSLQKTFENLQTENVVMKKENKSIENRLASIESFLLKNTGSKK